MSGAWALKGSGTDAQFVHNWHPGQQAAWDATQRYIGVIAGSGSGKTHLGGPWLYREARLKPGEEFIAVEPTWGMVNTVLWPTLRDIILPTGGVMREDYADVNCGNGVFSRIWFASGDKPQRAEGIHASGGWMDEAGQMYALMFETIVRRLRLKRGRLLLTTTPYDLGWLKQNFYDRFLAGDPAYFVSRFASTANPAYSTEEFEEARATMPDWRFRMFHLGEFDRPPGLIYGDYSDELRDDPRVSGHRVMDFVIPPSWPRFVGFDFGAVNTARVWLAQDPERDIFYAYRCSVEGGKTTNEHARESLALGASENVIVWAGGAKSEQQQRWDYQAAGVPMREPVITDVEAGIDRVIALFKTKRLFVFDSCLLLRDELSKYSRELDAFFQPTEKITKKQTFHVLDSLRYVVQHLEAPMLEGGGLL